MRHVAPIFGGDKVTPGRVLPDAEKSCTERGLQSVTRVVRYLCAGLKRLFVALASQKGWCDVEHADDWYSSSDNYRDGGSCKSHGRRKVDKHFKSG